MKIWVGDIYGVPVYSDPECPIMTWDKDSPQFRGLAKEIVVMQYRLKAQGLLLSGLTIDRDVLLKLPPATSEHL